MKSTVRKKISGEELLGEEGRENLPLYTIGVVAELAGITDQTLRLYEKHGLIKPARRGKDRYYSENDIKWLKCLRDLTIPPPPNSTIGAGSA